MAEPVGLQVQIPQYDLGSTLAKVAQIRNMQTQGDLAGLQLQKGQQEFGDLQRFGANPNDLSVLARHPHLYGEALKNQAFQQEQNVTQAARAAVDVLSAPEDRIVPTYQQKIGELRSRGIFNEAQHAQLSQVTDPEKIRTMARGLIAQHKPEMMLPHPGQVGSTLGMPEFGIYDPITQSVSNPSAATVRSTAGGGVEPTGGGAPLKPADIIRSGLTGQPLIDALAKSVGPGFANEIKSIAEYDQPFPPPGSRGQMDPFIKILVRQYQPNYDQSGYAAKQKVVTGMSSGTEAEQIKSFNTVPMHLAGLYQAVTKLNNSDFVPAVTNRVGNAVGGQFSTRTQDALGDFESSKKAVAGEMAKVFRSAGMSVAEIDDWKDSFDNSTSSTKMYSAIRKGVELIEGRMGAVANQWRTTPGLKDKPFDKVDPAAMRVFDLLRDARGPLTKEQEATLAQSAEKVRQNVMGQPGGRVKPGEKTDNGPLPQTQVAPPSGAVNLLKEIQSGAKTVTLPSGKTLSADEYVKAFQQKYGQPK